MPEGRWEEMELCRSLLEKVAGREHQALPGGEQAACWLRTGERSRRGSPGPVPGELAEGS